MSLIIAENVTQAFGANEVLKGVSFRLGEADRVGLVGPNGEGKTTLLRIVGGMLEPTAGKVHRSRGLRIGYLPQDPPALSGSTIHQAALEVFSDLRRHEEELGELAGRIAQGGRPEELKRYGILETRFEAMGGYEYPVRIEQVLTGLGFDRPMWERSLSELSGGQRTRVYLARLLLTDPQLLLLDEPTNHLDMDSVEWLERWLGSFRGTMVVVSHDRYFLDRVTTGTWEIADGCLETYRGAYSQYVVQRSERHQEQLRRWEAQQEHIAKTQDFIRRHIAGQRTKEARGRRKRLERFLEDEAIERPTEQQAMSLSLPSVTRTGDIVLRAENLAAGFDPETPLVQAEELVVVRGERIAVVGANGIGKTTLLRTLLGELEPLRGSVRLGANVSVGYLSQTHAELDLDTTALEAVLSAAEGITAEVARSLLGSLLLSGDDAFRKIRELSGGQRSRVVLARLVVQSSNVLALDEPTNHLDIPSTEIIQDVLRRFDGTVLLVSHDRYLVQAVATAIWAMDGGRIHRVTGGWEGYLRWRQKRSGQVAEGDGATPAKECRRSEFVQGRRRANELQRLRRRHEELESEIEQVEGKVSRLHDAISVAGQGGDVGKVQELGLQYQREEARLAVLWEEWERVGEELERRPA